MYVYVCVHVCACVYVWVVDMYDCTYVYFMVDTSINMGGGRWGEGVFFHTHLHTSPCGQG